MDSDSYSFYECVLTSAVQEVKLMKARYLSPLGHCEIYSFTHYIDLGFSYV